jgi:hypothetical protein
VTSEKLRDFVQRHHSLGANILPVDRELSVHLEFSFPKIRPAPPAGFDPLAGVNSADASLPRSVLFSVRVAHGLFRSSLPASHYQK